MFRKIIRKQIDTLAWYAFSLQPKDETEIFAIGSMLSKQQWLLPSSNINDHEFKVFSQFGDDGIIQYLIKHITIENKLFIEFGVENYVESNTRFLMMNNNWGGFVMDGSDTAMNELKNQGWYWKHNLTNKAAFIDAENINELLSGTGYSNIGILNIDLDGNDYYVLKEVDLSKLNPAIIIVEYNSIFGNERPITVPYDKAFTRSSAHYSNLFYGASLTALTNEANNKGYALIGCNTAGNNSYFVRKDLLNDKVKEVSVKEAYKQSSFREGRKKDGSLSLFGKDQNLLELRGMIVYNVDTQKTEPF